MYFLQTDAAEQKRPLTVRPVLSVQCKHRNPKCCLKWKLIQWVPPDKRTKCSQNEPYWWLMRYKTKEISITKATCSWFNYIFCLNCYIFFNHWKLIFTFVINLKSHDSWWWSLSSGCWSFFAVFNFVPVSEHFQALEVILPVICLPMRLFCISGVILCLCFMWKILFVGLCFPFLVFLPLHVAILHPSLACIGPLLPGCVFLLCTF